MASFIVLSFFFLLFFCRLLNIWIGSCTLLKDALLGQGGDLAVECQIEPRGPAQLS